ncbi:MAG: tetratricopeptide repeat protein [Planctomycetia bacterium]|nr:tetratricopeptide repeat protein [Planctomycetia bacterium]
MDDKLWEEVLSAGPESDTQRSVEALEAALQSGEDVDPVTLGQGLIAMATLLEEDDEADEEDIIKDYRKGIEILESCLGEESTADDYELIGSAYVAVAIHLSETDDIDAVLEQYAQARQNLVKAYELGNAETEFDIAGCDLNIANIYYGMERFEEAMALCEKAIKTFKKVLPAVEKETATSKELEYAFYLARAKAMLADCARFVSDSDPDYDLTPRIVDCHAATALYSRLSGQVEEECEIYAVTSMLVAADLYDLQDKPEDSVRLNEQAVNELNTIYRECICADASEEDETDDLEAAFTPHCECGHEHGPDDFLDLEEMLFEGAERLLYRAAAVDDKALVERTIDLIESLPHLAMMNNSDDPDAVNSYKSYMDFKKTLSQEEMRPENSASPKPGREPAKKK